MSVGTQVATAADPEQAVSKIPRITRVSISNFQSLEKVDLDLGPFTVIVGSSNTGKSALLRALKAVVRNVNSPSSVRVGKSTFTAQVTFGTDVEGAGGTAVSIERGKSHSTYRVVLADQSGQTGGEREEVFTKAGRSVPEEVQKVLGLPVPENGQPDLAFSSQIDPPFLLSENGTAAAKMLGDLTNVSTLHAAAREANRRRLDAVKTRKIRHEDALGCAQRLQEEFADLPAQAAALKDARALLESVRHNANIVERLEETLNQIATAEAAEQDVRDRLAELPEPADIDTLVEQADRLLEQRRVLVAIIDYLADAAQQEDALTAELENSESQVRDLGEQYHQVLKDAGQCPMCGQGVS